MLHLEENSPLEMLRNFAVHLDGDLREDLGAAKLTLDNENAKGSITLYEVFPGLTAWVYNIVFSAELSIDFKFSEDRPYYFAYHVEGHQLQKFPSEEEYQRIGKGQNFILHSEPGKNSEFVIPANMKHKSCFLIIHPNLLKENETKIKRELQSNLAEIFGTEEDKTPYRYFGNIDFRVGLFTEIIIENQRTDLVGRLTTEAAILNMLASQIKAHDYDKETESFQPNLTKSELMKISGLGDYIRENITEKPDLRNLSRRLGFSPKKLQAGVRFMFGCSVNEYLTNVRLEQAKELIQFTDMNISEICYGVGYSSRSYFSKLFRGRYGILPRDFKTSFEKDNLLFEISYRSMAKTALTEADIENILNTARAQNKKYDVTGSLIYHREVFFQIVEGNKEDVLRLYENIRKDQRHSDVTIIWQGAKPSRDFGNWNMAMLADDNVLNIPIEGNTKELDLRHLLGDIDDQSLAAKSLWRKVRNIIKTAS